MATNTQGPDGGYIDIGKECFSTPDRSVISWVGENYYLACDAFVKNDKHGGQMFCVKRRGHDPANGHESYSGAVIKDGAV